MTSGLPGPGAVSSWALAEWSGVCTGVEVVREEEEEEAAAPRGEGRMVSG